MPAVVRALSTAASVLRTSVLTGAISLTARMAVVLPAPAVPQIRIFSSLMHGGSRQLGKPLADAAENALGRTRGSAAAGCRGGPAQQADGIDRKSTRLNSSHLVISYAVFCLKKKKNHSHPVISAVAIVI